jgi:hypothetical protein
MGFVQNKDHRGMAWVIALVSMMMVAPQVRGEEGGKSALPAADVIIAKYIEAIGGKDALMKATSRHSVGKFSVPAQNLTGDLEVFSAAPNKQVVRISLPSIGEIRSGFDGETGWMMHPMMGNQVAEGARLEEMKSNAEFVEPLRYEKYVASMETVEQTDFEGKPCYKVKVVGKDGKESFEFFETDTGLQRGSSGQNETPMGPVDVVTFNAEWIEADGLKFPARTVQKLMGQEQIVTIEKVELNKVDASVFAIPEEIKKVMSGEASPTPPRRPADLEP